MAFLLHAKAISPNALTSAFASAACSAANVGKGMNAVQENVEIPLNAALVFAPLAQPFFLVARKAAHVNWDQRQLLGSEEVTRLRATCSTLRRRLSPMQKRSD